MDPHPYRSPLHRSLSPEHSQPPARGRPQDPWGRMGPSAPQRSTRAPQPWGRMGTLDTQGRTGPPSPRSRTGPQPLGQDGTPPSSARCPRFTAAGRCSRSPARHQCPQLWPVPLLAGPVSAGGAVRPHPAAALPGPDSRHRGRGHREPRGGDSAGGTWPRRQRPGQRRTRCPHADPRPCATPRWGQSHRVPRDRVSRPLPTGAAGTALPPRPAPGGQKYPRGARGARK